MSGERRYNKGLAEMTIKAALREAEKTGKPVARPDAHGLRILCQPDGKTGYWQYRYSLKGEPKPLLRLGVYPAIGLADARKRHAEQRELVLKGIDPAAMRREAKAKAKREAAKASTFGEAATAWFENHKKGLDSDYAQVVENRIKKWFATTLGPQALETIEAPDVIAAIKPIEAEGSIDLARRMKIIAGQVFRYGIAHGWCKHDPSASIGAALAPRPKVKHRAKLAESELPDFFRRLNAYDGYPITKLAIRFVMLAVPRTNELRFAEWPEIEKLDSDAPLWRIPAARMKMDKPHMVPLSTQAVAILKEARRLYPKSKVIFPSEESRSGVMSENAMLYALHYLGYKGKATVHGLRGTFSTICNENGFNSDWIELCLAHTDDDEVRAAYNAALWLPQRRTMLQWWGNFLTAQEAGTPVAPPMLAFAQANGSALAF